MATDRQIRRVTEERTVIIQEVDMSKNYISMKDQYGTLLRASVDFGLPVVVVPTPGEVWTAERRNTSWYLKRKQNATRNPDLQPGDVLIDGQPVITNPALEQSFWSMAAGGNVIHTGTVTTIDFTAGTWIQANGWSPGTFDTSTIPTSVLTFASFSTVITMLIVDWPAGTYDRYIELSVVNPALPQFTKNPRIRNGATPDGDRQTLTAIINGQPSPGTTITAKAFQASGSDKTVSASWYSQAINGKIINV